MRSGGDNGRLRLGDRCTRLVEIPRQVFLERRCACAPTIALPEDPSAVIRDLEPCYVETERRRTLFKKVIFAALDHDQRYLVEYNELRGKLR